MESNTLGKVIACFDSAIAEGLDQALENAEGTLLATLVKRHLMQAYNIAIGPETQSNRPDKTAEVHTAIQHLENARIRTTVGEWQRGETSHDTVVKVPKRPDYKVASFRHADDASFVDLAHKHVPLLVEHIRRLEAEKRPRQEEGFDVVLSEGQETSFAAWVGVEQMTPWQRSVARLALLLNTTKRGLIDYGAAQHFANELFTRTTRNPD